MTFFLVRWVLAYRQSIHDEAVIALGLEIERQGGSVDWAQALGKKVNP